MQFKIIHKIATDRSNVQSVFVLKIVEIHCGLLWPIVDDWKISKIKNKKSDEDELDENERNLLFGRFVL